MFDIFNICYTETRFHNSVARQGKKIGKVLAYYTENVIIKIKKNFIK